MPKAYNRKHNNAPPGAIYVGRPTKWGNNYTHLKGKTLAGVVVDSLDDALNMYFGDLIVMYVENLEGFRKLIDPLRHKDLVCWCAPPGGLDFTFGNSICHAQILGALTLMDTLFVETGTVINLADIVDVEKVKKEISQKGGSSNAH